MSLNRVTRVAGLLAAAVLLNSTTEAWQTQPTPTYHPGARVCVIHDFGAQAADAMDPTQIGAIARGDDGFYYSTSQYGGKSATTQNQGTIYRFSPANNNVEVRYSFDFTVHGATPQGGLIKGNDGYFYGTTSAGGFFNTDDRGHTKLGSGVLFRFKPGDTEPEVVQTFRYGDRSGIPMEAVCRPNNRPCHSPQQKMNAAGGIPLSAPVLASDSNLYGVTSGAVGYPNLGVLYKVAPYKGESAITALCIGGPMPQDPNITDDALRDACMFSGKNGSLPLGLTAGGNGELFGTTLQVNANSNGTVFKAEIPSGKVTTLYNFSDPKNGRMPYGVIKASDGRLYGVTKYGGPRYGLGNAGSGVLFRLSPEGGGFRIVHAFNGTTEGSLPVAGLVEASSPNGNVYLYGSTAAGGDLRGVLFRVLIGQTGPPAPGDPFPYQLLHVFPILGGATGSFPLSTMVAANDSTHGLTFYGTTWSGGAADHGVLYRLRGVDLPPVQNLYFPPKYSLRPDAIRTGPEIVSIAGQPLPTTIDVYAGAVAQASVKTPAESFSDNGLMIKTGNCRNPHILQFVYREKIGADGHHYGGLYTLTNKQVYELTTNPDHPNWHTDTSEVHNAYYDQQYAVLGVPVEVGPFSLTFFDQPNFGGLAFLPGAHETWRATFKDYVICNCQAVGEVRWTREVPWIIDLPSSPNVTVDVNKGHQGPPRYVDISIVPPTDDPNMDWANQQLRKDGFDPVP